MALGLATRRSAPIHDSIISRFFLFLGNRYEDWAWSVLAEPITKTARFFCDATFFPLAPSSHLSLTPCTISRISTAHTQMSHFYLAHTNHRLRLSPLERNLALGTITSHCIQILCSNLSPICNTRINSHFKTITST